MFEKIKDGEIYFPKFISDDAKDLIQVIKNKTSK